MPIILPDGGPALGLGSTYYTGIAQNSNSSTTVETVDRQSHGCTFLENYASAFGFSDNSNTNNWYIALLFHTGGANNWNTAEIEVADDTTINSKYTGLFTRYLDSNAAMAESGASWRWDAAQKYMILDVPWQLQVQNTKTTPVVYNYVVVGSSDNGSYGPGSSTFSYFGNGRGAIIAIIAEDGNITLNPGEMSKNYGLKPTVSWYTSYP